MTERKRAVPDDILGKVSRKIFDLGRRLLERGADPKRAEFFVQLALESEPRADWGHSSCSWGMYVLESQWSWDNSHYDFATFSLEKCYNPIGCEKLLDPDTPQKEKDRLLEEIKKLHNAQMIGPGPRMVRLYRVVSANYFGTNPSTNFGQLERNMADIHFSLLPICNFDKDGKPVPCTVVA
jgi:hypothetical protein